MFLLHSVNRKFTKIEDLALQLSSLHERAEQCRAVTRSHKYSEFINNEFKLISIIRTCMSLLDMLLYSSRPVSPTQILLLFLPINFQKCSISYTNRFLWNRRSTSSQHIVVNKSVFSCDDVTCNFYIIPISLGTPLGVMKKVRKSQSGICFYSLLTMTEQK